LLIEN